MADKTNPKILSQFARIESHAMVATKSRPKNPPENWKAKTSVEGCCGEALHLDTHAKHVEKPADVDVIYGMNPMDFYGAIKTRFNEIKKSGVRIKADQMVMCSGVFSYPKTECDEDYFLWVDDSIAYLKEKYGDRLKSVVAHYDESHPHLHFFIADMKTLSVNELDPFRIARREEEAKKMAMGKNEKGDYIYAPKMKAQKEKMAQWLDEYHEKVSVKYGQARDVGARKARIFGTPRQVNLQLAMNQRERDLNEKEALLIAKKDRMIELGKTLAEQTALTNDKNKMLDMLLDQLTQEVEMLKEQKKLGAAVSLNARISEIRKTAYGGGAASGDKMKLN